MTPEVRMTGGVPLLHSGLACGRHTGLPGMEPGHMWLWWTDVNGEPEYRGFWPNAEGIDDPAVLENPPLLLEYLKKNRTPGEIRRDRAAQIVNDKHLLLEISGRSVKIRW